MHSLRFMPGFDDDNGSGGLCVGFSAGSKWGRDSAVERLLMRGGRRGVTCTFSFFFGRGGSLNMRACPSYSKDVLQNSQNTRVYLERFCRAHEKPLYTSSEPLFQLRKYIFLGSLRLLPTPINHPVADQEILLEQILCEIVELLVFCVKSVRGGDAGDAGHFVHILSWLVLFPLHRCLIDPGARF